MHQQNFIYMYVNVGLCHACVSRTELTSSGLLARLDMLPLGHPMVPQERNQLMLTVVGGQSSTMVEHVLLVSIPRALRADSQWR